MTYQPPHLAHHPAHPQLDVELAQLGYACVHGWPDQRPITPALVRSRLAAPALAPPTLVVTIRTHQGELAAAAALRHPASPTATARLWGPLVHPTHQRHGLGHSLLNALTPHLPPPGTRVTTAEIPQERTAATAFLTTRGWTADHGAVLLKAPLPLPAIPHPPDAIIRPARPGEDLTRIDALHAAARPGDPNATGAGVRWAADERFDPPCLTLAEADGRLLAAALVYPLAHTQPHAEPAEALLGDLLLHPQTHHRPAIALHTARRALEAAHQAGAHIVRAIVPEPDTTLRELTHRLGLTPRAILHCYRPPQK
ncbi:GNAT family N-acetyltransferase [Streptomyces sp. AJS327]|uniref:GNAT family N-acetyltransferase n=1 Tax=Streptomyces sp. AJS327 TaxID=2545265 RepID=UPI0015DFB051|nr:GNAT family N-acetyltransferase [Streptomyces sp. AJS327]